MVLFEIACMAITKIIYFLLFPQYNWNNLNISGSCPSHNSSHSILCDPINPIIHFMDQLVHENYFKWIFNLIYQTEFHGNSDFFQIPWKTFKYMYMEIKSIKFHETIPWKKKQYGIPWKKTSMEFHGIPWNKKPSMEFHVPKFSMELHGKFSIEFHGTPWNSMEFHGIPWNSMSQTQTEFHGIPWKIFHGIPWGYFTRACCRPV